MLADARARGCERILNLGDLGRLRRRVRRGLAAADEFGVESIAGNYDIAIGRGDDDCGCGYSFRARQPFAQLMYDHTRAPTSPSSRAWMRELPGELREEIGGVDVHAVHGSPLAVNDFLWESLPDDELRERRRASGSDVLLCTHTGIPWQRPVDGTLVVNVGAVGPAPRTTAGGHLVRGPRPRRTAWPRRSSCRSPTTGARRPLRCARPGLPEAFVETIETGWWTTCLEVVPPPERSRGRYHVYRDAMPSGFAADGAGWADAPAGGRRPAGCLDVRHRAVPAAAVGVLELPLQPGLRLLRGGVLAACAQARDLGRERFQALVDEAVEEGFRELYVTGGEPFVHPPWSDGSSTPATASRRSC